MRPRRTRHAEEAVSHERWLISYSDFVTLLFAFFVVLFASTYRDNQDIRKLAQAIHNGFQTMGAFTKDESGNGGVYSTVTVTDDDSNREQKDKITVNSTPPQSMAEMLALRKELEKAMGEEVKKHEVVLQITPEGFVISLKELGFFSSGQASLMPGAGDKIERIAKILGKPGLDIRIEGHSDNQPIHTAQFGSNWDLSAARAMTVLQLLVNDAGFDPGTLSVAGYGEYRPVADNSTPEGRRMNRRVDLVVVQSRPIRVNTP